MPLNYWDGTNRHVSFSCNVVILPAVFHFHFFVLNYFFIFDNFHLPPDLQKRHFVDDFFLFSLFFQIGNFCKLHCVLWSPLARQFWILLTVGFVHACWDKCELRYVSRKSYRSLAPTDRRDLGRWAGSRLRAVPCWLWGRATIEICIRVLLNIII